MPTLIAKAEGDNKQATAGNKDAEGQGSAPAQGGKVWGSLVDNVHFGGDQQLRGLLHRFLEIQYCGGVDGQGRGRGGQ